MIEEPLFNETSGYVAKMSGFVIAPYTGNFEFYIAASDKVALFISNTSMPNNNPTLVAYSENPITSDNYGEKSLYSLALEGIYIILLLCR